MSPTRDTWTDEPDEAALEVDSALDLPERYEDLGPLGAGGMGEVRRVRDRELSRVVAMKVVKAGSSAAAIARFREEAQVAAQLQHPGIVPVHDLGLLPDGRLWFTMKEVRGTTLGDRIAQVHAAARVGQEQTSDGWSLRRLIDALARVAEAVGYAHDRGVVHRDLKPDNVMLGDHGEVLVLDWGLARVMTEAWTPVDAVHSLRSTGDSLRTQAGAVAGTPSYMAPEQARAEHDRIGPATDVWALGGMLYELLCGDPPYAAPSRRALVALVAMAPAVRLPGTRSALPVAEELSDLAMAALAPEVDDRPSDATALARRLFDWLDGAKNKERALDLIAEADALRAGIRRSRREAEVLQSAADAQLRALPADAPEAQRWGPWTMQDEARRLEDQAERSEAERLRLLRSSLSFVPGLPEAYDRLATHYVRSHMLAESKGDAATARALEDWIRAYDRGQHTAYLEGTGTLSLTTEVPAEVTLLRYTERRRRLVPELERTLGTTPLDEVPVAMGSYLLEIRAKGREVVRYPVQIGRGQHWDGVRPGEQIATVVELPNSVPEGMVYVPAGWYEAGTDQEALANPVPRQRVWVDAFAIGRDSVTNGEYVGFLNDLVDRGDVDLAERHAPKMGGKPIYPRSEGGHFRLGKDAHGSDWRPTMPVVCVTWASAMAYCAWLGGRLGREVRLPFELEWEKAARGVDARIYPWGAQRCAEWSWTRERAVKAPGPCDVGTHPQDVSPYGMRDVAGNVFSWLMDTSTEFARVQGGLADTSAVEARGHRRVRGGGWERNSWFCRIDTTSSSAGVMAQLGFRTVVSSVAS
ncbi:MAG: SUMF1/EgtB/PvdO family nonheme iron enzyme [Proteobacteria bacterium]|nr:SUMF1/EgtB/PvdO family nonheme iron enzyme [Pseudomonadota bacterium]